MMSINSLFSRRFGLPPSLGEEAHVLAVDDSLVDRKVIERLLKFYSCKVTAVDSVKRALQFLGLDQEVTADNASVVQGLKVDLIITDYSMPELTGYELLKKIKESSTFREIPVVIMSSENILARIDRCLEEGAEDFIVKPVKLSDMERLREHFTAKDVSKSKDTTLNNKRKQPDGPDLATSPNLSESSPSIALPESSPSPPLSPREFSPPSPDSPTRLEKAEVLDSPSRKLKSSSSDLIVPDSLL